MSRILLAQTLIFLCLGLIGQAHADQIATPSGTITVDVTTDGSYQVASKSTGWVLKGHVVGPAQKIAAGKGTDKIGAYQELAFGWTDATRPMTGTIRVYDGRDVVLFSETSVQALTTAPPVFPDFDTIPTGLSPFSFHGVFAPPAFRLENNSAPWLLFDPQAHALILSPASEFLPAMMIGDGKTRIASGFTDKLAGVPAGFTHQSLLAWGDGINATWDSWGHALTDLHGKTRPVDDADTVLKYYGYWTDNGGAYWYNYDPALGYAGTLNALVKSYKAKQIPLHYLQLDSWWYHKTLTMYNGKVGSAKNPKLPEGEWNRYGGTLSYTSDKFVFPDGVEGFHKEVGLPFVTHNRWIDPTSPYHQRFQISGIAAVDPKFWDEIAGFMKANNIETYEQDWLSDINAFSPELISTVDKGDLFLDNMARATKEHGQTLQYCMALPAYFMQGSKFDNLTSIRCSGDKFGPTRYRDFLYTSRLAGALGIWPWSDVFRSVDMSDLVISNLSAGPFGTGDAIGMENKENIFKAVRADGVIVKPDAPLVPIDAAYLAEAAHQDVPLVASTYSEHGGLKTFYVAVVKERKSKGVAYSITPAQLGVAGPAWYYDYFAGTAQLLDKDKTLAGSVDDSGLALYIVAPVSKSGIAFLGDAGKIASMGVQRIVSVQDEADQIQATVELAANESQVTLHGYAPASPKVFVESGSAGAVSFDPATKHFSFVVKPASGTADTSGADPVVHIKVSLSRG